MKEGLNRKDELYNALIDNLKEKGCSFKERLDDGQDILQVSNISTRVIVVYRCIVYCLFK